MIHTLEDRELAHPLMRHLACIQLVSYHTSLLSTRHCPNGAPRTFEWCEENWQQRTRSLHTGMNLYKTFNRTTSKLQAN